MSFHDHPLFDMTRRMLQNIEPEACIIDLLDASSEVDRDPVKTLFDHLLQQCDELEEWDCEDQEEAQDASDFWDEIQMEYALDQPDQSLDPNLLWI